MEQGQNNEQRKLEDKELLAVLKELHQTLELITVAVRVNSDLESHHSKFNNKLLFYKMLCAVFAIFFGFPILLLIVYVIYSLFTGNVR